MHLNALKFLEPGGEYAMLQVVGGLNWNATENLLLNVDLKYTWVTSETTESTSTAGTALVYEDMDLTNLGLRGGLSYKF